MKKHEMKISHGFSYSVAIQSITLRHITIFVSSPANVNKKHTTVSVDCGQVRGLYAATSNAYSFRGIPYASPPVDKLRWRSPVPVNSSNNNCWLGLFTATQFGSHCFQMNAIYNATGTLGSEDCLNLNIWTPSLNSTAELPVMFWIHGGFLLPESGIDKHKVADYNLIVYIPNANKTFFQVSLFGQSSGGTAVNVLHASPLARGLFHKA
ncbi:SASB-like protein [Mya arenaria]|uniref:SASB-like protein n=1 Tax=Mya arenaria TaxID=6604 RepID=A0ABY7FTZ7_MYAAR|nr:SASB-like protein [Mya arenaria]